MGICKAEHTKIQPEDWLCPNCSKGVEFFNIVDTATDASDTCDLLHCDDDCYCSSCKWSGYGSDVIELLEYNKGLVCCPSCGGKGVVTAEQLKEISDKLGKE